MKKSYFKGAMIVLVFIFASLYLYSSLNQPVLLSPGTSFSSMNLLFLVLPIIIGILIVTLVYFLIMSNLE